MASVAELEERLIQLENEVRSLKENAVGVDKNAPAPRSSLSPEEILALKNRAEELGTPVGPVGSGMYGPIRKEGN